MIFDGIRGYIKGSLDLPAGTVLAITKGPIKGKNWHNNNFNPTYEITITPSATGTVTLEGTNDVVFASSDDSGVSADFLPPENATWDTLQAATSTTVSGTITTSYWFLRLRIVTQGDGTVINAWVYWN
jgi:hypothetical protein